MSYNPNIPQANDRPSQSQGQILTNFQQADIGFFKDHISWTNAVIADRGKHKSVTLKASSIPSTASTDLALYSRTSGGEVKLFFRYPSDGTTVRLSNVDAPQSTDNGYTWLPGGMALQWGFQAVPGNVATTINFPIEFNGNPFSVNLTWARDSTGDSIAYIYTGNFNPSSTGFQAFTNKGGTPMRIYWMAIGPAL